MLERETHGEEALGGERQDHPDVHEGRDKRDVRLNFANEIVAVIQRTDDVRIDPAGKEIDEKENIAQRQEEQVRRRANVSRKRSSIDAHGFILALADLSDFVVKTTAQMRLPQMPSRAKQGM